MTKQGRISMATQRVDRGNRRQISRRLSHACVASQSALITALTGSAAWPPLQQAQVADVYERPFDVQQGMLLAQGRIERPQVDLPDDAVEGTLAIERHQSRALPLRPRPRPQRQQCARRVSKRGQNGQRFEVRLGGFAGLVRGWQVAPRTGAAGFPADAPRDRRRPACSRRRRRRRDAGRCGPVRWPRSDASPSRGCQQGPDGSRAQHGWAIVAQSPWTAIRQIIQGAHRNENGNFDTSPNWEVTMQSSRGPEQGLCN